MIRADLHIHTFFSDGLQSPMDVIVGAKKAGLNVISVTDHDNMNGTETVKKLCEENNIIAVDGIEISAYQGVKVHILGYNVDSTHPAFIEFYQRLCSAAEERTADILQKLKKVGINLTLKDVLRERTCEKSPLHSSYIARAAARKGYVSVQEMFLNYLNLGKCAYSSVGRPTPEEAVEVIKTCGGISSLAHPGRITLDKENKLKLIDNLKSCGLDGIEAVYSGHTESDTAYYKEIASKKNLLVTGGSDTHFTTGSRSIGHPAFYPDEKLLRKLKIN
jgi:hypothetical protein